MKVFTAEQVADGLPYAGLIEALRNGFAAGITSPQRHVHQATSATLMLMPAWGPQWSGIKILTLKADNPGLGLPFIQGQYVLIDNNTGCVVACLEGQELTRRRTAAASALAAGYLARTDAATHLIVGAGSLGAYFAEAFRAVRDIKQTLIWNRDPAKAIALAERLEGQGKPAQAVTDLERAVSAADIISCITSSTSALIKGEWLRPGVHLDLAGAYRPDMREVDGQAVARSTVFVDTGEGAAHEAGDLLQAQAEGMFEYAAIKGDLKMLCAGEILGRRSSAEITLFKSCGTAIEDLAAAAMVYLRDDKPGC